MPKNKVKIVKVRNIGNQHGSWIEFTFEYLRGMLRGETFIQRIVRNPVGSNREDAISQVEQTFSLTIER